MIDEPKSKPLAGNKKGLFYGYVILAAAFIIMVACFGINFAFGIFFKPMMTEFNWTRAITSGAFSVSWIVCGLVSIPIGGLADKFGPRVVITGCGLVLGLGNLLMSQVSAAWHLYLFYGVIIGCGISVYVPLASTIARWFGERRSMMTGILVAGSGVGALIGPPIAEYLIKAYDWRSAYMIVGVAVLLVIIPFAQLLRRDPSQVKQTTSSEKVSTQQELKSGTMGFTLKEAAYTRQFWLAFFIFFCVGFCLYSVQIHLAPHATDIGLSTTTAANILAIMGGTSIMGRVALGMVGDKIGNRLVYIIVFCLMSVTLLWLIFSKDVWGFFLFAAIFGIAYGGGIAQQSPLVAKLFGVGSLGLVLGVASLGFTIGASVGPLVTGYIFDVSGTYQIAFIINVIIGIIGFTLTMMLRPVSLD
ncbi:MAG: MFS transporter [Chloroflexi bacterium]|nr:MFS transporter [Chloroflexota bacterium]